MYTKIRIVPDNTSGDTMNEVNVCANRPLLEGFVIHPAADGCC
jgi:hypothetical protein